MKSKKTAALFQGTDFRLEESSPFSLLFFSDPKSLDEAPFPIYGGVDERGMEFLVTVFSLKALLKHFSFLKVSDIDFSKLLESWLKQEKKVGTALKISKRSVKNLPFEAYDTFFSTPHGLAVRARFIKEGNYLYVLSTRVKDPLYQEDMLEQKTDLFNLYRRDYRRSREYFTSFSFQSIPFPKES
jgi:hypothetical protein